MQLISKCTETRAHMSFCYDYLIYSLYYLLLMSDFSFGPSFVFIPVYMKRFI